MRATASLQPQESSAREAIGLLAHCFLAAFDSSAKRPPSGTLPCFPELISLLLVSFTLPCPRPSPESPSLTARTLCAAAPQPDLEAVRVRGELRVIFVVRASLLENSV